MIERFEEILKELGTIVNLPLHPDKNGVCKLNINNVLHVHIELDPSREKLLVASLIFDLPPGRFRENVFKAALKVNNAYPRIGTIAFSKKTNKLTLFDYLPLTELTGEKMGIYLGKFIEVADQWRTALEGGYSGPPSQKSSSSQLPNPFGL